jgi:hypothetical protein
MKLFAAALIVFTHAASQILESDAEPLRKGVFEAIE